MRSIRTLLLVCPAACLLAQNPPPKKAAPPPQPQMSLQAENVNKPMPSVPPDRVVITVGDVKITAAQFDQIIDTLGEQYRSVARGAGRKRFADNLVGIFAMAEEARRRKLDETPAFKAQLAFATDSVLASDLYQEIGSGIQPDEAALRAYYEAHKNQFEEVHARHILIRSENSAMPVKPGEKVLTDAEALAKAQDIRKKILAGADFAALARAESDDTGSAPNGGDLGFFGHGRMVPSFEQAAFSLKPGEVSEPVKSQFGYHIIKVEAVKGFEECRAQVESSIRPELTRKAVEEIQKKATVTLDPEFFDMEKK